MTIHKPPQRAWIAPWWVNQEFTCDSCERIVSFDLKDAKQKVIIYNHHLEYQCMNCGIDQREDQPTETKTIECSKI